MNSNHRYGALMCATMLLFVVSCSDSSTRSTDTAGTSPVTGATPASRGTATPTVALAVMTATARPTSPPNTTAAPAATVPATAQATSVPEASATVTASPTPWPTLTPRPPGVEILSPSSFNPIRARTPLYFAVNALSPSGLQRVEFYINDQLVASREANGAQEYNLTYGWQTDVNGDYRIQAKAVDANGQVLQSVVAIQPVRGGVDAVVNGTPQVSQIGSVVYIPNGTFRMGNSSGPDEEQPVHEVALSAYEIDQFEVTVGQFREFVKATQRQSSAEGAGEPITRTWRVDDTPSRWEHPVRFVSWWDADAYCRWQDKRLPTEAEWEYAARGSDLRLYPWGNDFDAARVPSGDTAPVGFHSSGASPFGLYDMAGNVWEWTDDWFDPLYYRSSDHNNPQPPKNTDQKTIRGGGYNNPPEDMRTTRRIHNFPDTYHQDVGFRCVRVLAP